MRGSSGFLGDLETTVYVSVSHDRISLESSHVMAVSSGNEVASNKAVLHALSKVRKPGMELKDEQTLAYTCRPLSFVTVPGNICLR